MPIDFSCNHCGKKLRVPDDFAGKKAKCPQCQEVVSIPAADAPDPFAGAPSDPLGGGGEPNPFEGIGSPDTPQQSSPFEGIGASDTPQKPTPQSAQNPYSSPQASSSKPAAGAVDGPVQNVAVEFGDVFNHALETWKANMVPLALGALASIGIPWLCFAAFFLLSIVADLGVFIFLGQLVLIAASMFFMIGYLDMLIKIARGQPAAVGDLFKIPGRLGPMIGVILLFGLMVSIGSMLCVIPGLILLVMFWPAQLLVLEGKADVIESFTVARSITANNTLTIILVWLVGGVIANLGALACGVGVFVSIPLAQLLWVTAYLMMSGQLATKSKALA